MWNERLESLGIDKCDKYFVHCSRYVSERMFSLRLIFKITENFIVIENHRTLANGQFVVAQSFVGSELLVHVTTLD